MIHFPAVVCTSSPSTTTSLIGPTMASGADYALRPRMRDETRYRNSVAVEQVDVSNAGLAEGW
jgi:hypothetical protein